MIINDWIHVIAGLFILISLALGADLSGNPLFISKYWLLFTAFVGLNLFQFGLSKFCPMALILKKLGVPESKTH
ncbi:MAG: sulfurtransferase [Desulfobulbus propionicus]|nr:MAG: sulfurtransferase [Desulfobulbus propionicus]